MIYFLYNSLLILATPLIVAYHVWRSVSRGRPAALAERFGHIPASAVDPLAGKSVIWVHAVSVGETIAVRPLIKALKERYPEKKVVVSNMTETGRGVAEKMTEVDLCLYFPFDYASAAARLLDLVNPDLIIIVETELWPNFLRVARRRGIPTVMVNGRISDRSFKGYLRLKRVFRTVLGQMTSFCMQSEEDRRRIIAIGAPADRVQVCRNLKYDIPVAPPGAERREELHHAYGIPATVTVVTAGSTHQGEEELIIEAYRRLLPERPDLFLILVPRHPERAPQVADLLRQAGFAMTLRSQLAQKAAPFAPGEVLLVDTIGELMSLYAVADLVFVGGSLVPTGGHNILEPVSLRVPVMFGPHMSNFREIGELILACGGGRQVVDLEELTKVARALLDDPAERQLMAERAAGFLSANSGSTARHLDAISALLP